MAEIPDHLLQRSAERRRQLGLPVPGDEGAPVAASSDASAEPTAAAPEESVSAPATAEVPSAPEPESVGGVPAHLLARSQKRKAALAGGEAAPATAGAGAVATATKPIPTPSGTGPGGHTQRLLTVVKSGSIQQTKAEAQDKVHTWPHLLVMEFASILAICALLIVFSAFVRAPLLQLRDFNKTPNPSKAPWYFLGLQELLTMFQPMVAGVTIPGIAMFMLMVAPFVDKNPSNKPSDRKFAISLFTMFMMFWAVLVIIGSFFRGPGFNFVFPWKDGIFFEL